MKGALLVLVLGFSLLRFVNLNADFPTGITWSSELYTDEGQNAASAIRHVLTGQWYLAGDVNTAVYAPVGHVLHRMSFALFGLSLSSVRVTIIVSFLLLVLTSALLVRRSYGDYAALLTALLLASNYVGFAYSRLATMDLVATSFVVASLCVAGGLKGKSSILRLLVASSLLAIGMLTKLTAVFAVPLLAFVAWRGGSSLKQRVLFVAASALVLAVLYGGYRIAMSVLFSAEYARFNHQTLGDTFTTLRDWVRYVPHKVLANPEYLGYGFMDLTALFTASAFAVSKRFRRDPLTHLLVGYTAAYVIMLSLHRYGPPRYYLPLLVPFAGLCATACIALVDRFREIGWSVARAMPVILVVLALDEGLQIVSYLSRPTYSFYRMAHAVGKIIQEREGAVHGVLLFGDVASSVSLEIGTNAVNTLPGTDVAGRIAECHPRYMVVHTSNITEIAATEGAEVDELGAWDVFRNYYGKGERVRLYAVRWP
jgi:4-amino-4-deoxy-L-arabinose transferase-like glycosyltransferase